MPAIRLATQPLACFHKDPALHLVRTSGPLPAEFLGGAVAVGNFDGVHRGHARLVERLLTRAREVSGPAVVLTFDPHPVRILRPELAPPPLTWSERKAELLSELGVTAVWSYPTDEALLRLTAEEFFQQIIVQSLRAKGMVEGPNFRFGQQRRGDVALLQGLCASQGLKLDVVEPLATAGDLVSSSRVRDLIRQGDVAAARQLLTRPYRLRGLVTHGAQRGSKIGFPTANLAGIDTLVPPIGVYAGRAFTPQGIWPAAINIGPNPTFGEDAFKFEAHLPGFSGSLYGQPLEIEFLARVRDTRPFASVAELTQQLAADVQTVLKTYEQDTAEDA
ncbi:Riboflavin kinase [Anatilimnocola aggregata]|uniref:Riboflavin biosynthesis protein n=1 Tax=Anatilimnocola aggregata TaxID=2528021 RepID=A0A517YAW3_9BACT|nr:riboflavin biosynthesis protein RibF [Anatilimnocola aggregata]QDU27373.1 Riboflavin kinase [Anatilimnocola aggregata]